MSTDSELQDSIERTRQAFRAAPDAPSLVVRREEPSWQSQRETTALHPFIRGLIEALPEPGAEWPESEREKWLETARHIFGLIYADSGPPAGSDGQPARPSMFERRDP